jgi:hypothetical protein
MSKNKILSRFANTKLSGEYLDKFSKVLGPVINYTGAETISYLNLRIILNENFGFVHKVLNKRHQISFNNADELVQCSLRSFSDAIFLKSINLNKLSFSPNELENENIPQNTFYINSSRQDTKKPIGIYSPDIKLNNIKNYPLYSNQNLYKYIYTKKSKVDKLIKLYDEKMLEEFK